MHASRTKDFSNAEGSGEGFPSIKKTHTGGMTLKKSNRFSHDVCRESAEDSLPAYESKRKYKPAMLSESNIERGLNKYRN